MTRGRLLFFALSAVVVLFLVAGSLLGAVAGSRGGDENSFYKVLSVFSEVLNLVRHAYVEERDVGGLMAGAFDGVTDALDPFSVYVPAASAEAFAAAEAVGTRRSGLRLLKERGMAYVVGVEEGSPAAAAGVEPGDLVAKVQGRSTRLLPLWQLQRELAAAPGTKVELELIRRGEPRPAAFALAQFQPPPPSLAPQDAALVLRIPSFDAATVEQVARLLAAPPPAPGAGGPSGLLIDLRGVGGGDPVGAYAVADLFADGALGTLRGRGEPVSTFDAARPNAWSGPLVVAVDRGTLGAAEVLAAVLRQTVKARLVGERTFGYAGRQRLVTLPSGDRLRITDAFFAGPDGETIDDSLVPDVLVDERARRFGEQDVPLRELILRRGLRLLSDEQARAAA